MVELAATNCLQMVVVFILLYFILSLLASQFNHHPQIIHQGFANYNNFFFYYFTFTYVTVAYFLMSVRMILTMLLIEFGFVHSVEDDVFHNLLFFYPY